MFFLTVEMKYCKLTIGTFPLFDQPVEHMKILEKVTICQGEDYITGFLLDYPYYKVNKRNCKATSLLEKRVCLLLF